MRNSIKHAFICDFCRNSCPSKCFEELMDIKNGKAKPGSEQYEKSKDLIGRKRIIHCLGKYCDTPCEFQREEYTPFNEDDGISPLIDAIKYLISKCNEILITDKNG